MVNTFEFVLLTSYVITFDDNDEPRSLCCYSVVRVFLTVGIIIEITVILLNNCRLVDTGSHININ